MSDIHMIAKWCWEASQMGTGMGASAFWKVYSHKFFHGSVAVVDIHVHATGPRWKESFKEQCAFDVRETLAERERRVWLMLWRCEERILAGEPK